ncbi:Zinc finger, RING-type [Penicillium expansum]|uniref:Zinc finger, RING-type n=1 Tax=Penicillium expansum TaxID=27334 RepID=A0A0A2JAI1_PENEN|nr:Zinc finger, RING-type [Penicillium expansum]KGO52427.1 Zinc finger, RING-type [Penicillium expansum]KGO66657.1 Zinc finger, RING-type [Penicillium expansum]
MASKGVPQQQSADGLAKDDQEPRARADEIPELRRGCEIPRGRYLANDLPPLHTLTEIFADMASNALKMGFEHVLIRLGGRPLRVATMCSGTEAPLLALELIQTGLAEAQQLRISHAFSCEIVPFKQSYIERNFRPPILFRDITELGGDVGRTAYGSSEVIPGDLDILVAGTACVDFSPLNNRKKTLQQGGESGATFDGLLRYAERYRPRMVVQENVRNAPWDQMKGKWEELGYMSVCVNVDTKNYYIPQTRERGYMVVIDKRRLEAAGLLGGSMDQSGIDTVTQRVRELARRFKRPASAPVGLFLLSDDDRRLELIEMRARLESRSETSWDQYQIRHERHRGELELGIERPITRSLPGINDLKAPDFYWHRFWKTQPERVWETVDMNFLKKMVQDYDMNFKERWIDLSQGVDRGNDSLAGSGIAGCLTPKGIPFVTTRGGPVSGTEALSLQGLPLDRMLLTRETQADLMDMAGNAMTSTVVCAIMLAGLIAVHEILDDDEAGSINPGDAEAKSLLVPSEAHSLVRSNLQIAEAPLVDHAVLKAKAASSVLCCSCERQTGVQDSIYSCTLCGHTACRSCRGNPTHSYLHVSPLSRQKPSEFIANLKGLVPMKLMLSGLSVLDFETFRSLYPIDNLPQFWPDFVLCVKAAVHDVFRFFEIKRGRKWRVVYDGTHSSLFLDIGPDSIQWLLYAKPPKSASTRSVIREVLAKPISRMSPTSGSFVEGTWEVCSPVSTPFSLQISGRGSQVRSFQSECGLKAAKFVDGKVWDSIFVEGSNQDVAVLDLDVRGIYKFLPDCGTALGALYKKEATAHVPPMFLFLDPTKTGPPDEDACVFALYHSRLPGYDVRMTIAELPSTWRSLDVTLDSQDVKAFCRQWAKAPRAQLNHCPAEQITLSTLQQGIQVSIENQHCHDACITLTSLSATTAILNLPDANSDWQAWNPEVSMRELKGLAWLFPKIAAWSDFEDWTEIILPDCSDPNHHAYGNCNTCNPLTPSILWGRDNKDRIIPYENPQEAAVYEHAIKNRPSPFLVFRRISEHGDAELRFTLNVQALTHQAHGKLVGTASRETVTSRWRLLPHAYDMAQKTPDMSQAAPGRFTLRSNDNDNPSPQPPNFKFKLRDEQLRSLSWMISQEAKDMKPFMEEEVEESILPLMPWRAEVKATMPKIVRGGVLADEVGYGKTAVILGLIDAQYKTDTIPPEDNGLISTKATLIVVPSNVFKQWVSETSKFLEGKYKVLAISSINKISIREVKEADIVILSWSILANDSYYKRLQQFTGTPQAPAKSSGGTGRNFDGWFHDARASLRESVEILKTEGPEAMLQQLEARRRRVHETQANFTYVPSRRLRGQAFADANNGRDESDAEAEEDLDSESDSGFEEIDASDARQSTGTASPVDQRKRRYSRKSVEGSKEKRQKRLSTDLVEVTDDKKKRGAKSTAVKDDRTEFDIKKGVKGRTKQDWRTVKAAFIHAFNFNRLVIDEYTYAGEERQASLLSLQARSKWILSGTPALGEFADIKSIARYLCLHLGVDDDGDCDKPTQNSRLRNIRKNHTAVEAFQYYQAPHSNAWYQNRREHAQRFLDRFARQNIARITHIPLITHLVITEQSPAEKTAYDTLFRAVKENKRRIPGLLGSILSKSQFPQEALIMSCVTSQIGQPPWNLEKCLKGSRNDKKKSAEIWTKVDSITRQAATVWYREMNNTNAKDWQNALNGVAKTDSGDAELNKKFNELLKGIIHSYSEWKLDEQHRPIEDLLKARVQKIQNAKTGNTVSGTRPPRVTGPGGTNNTSSNSVWTAVEKSLSADVTSLLKQALEIDQEYRFYEHLVKIQTIGIPQCQNCKSDLEEKKDVNVLKICGHALCKNCLDAAITQQHKPCPVLGCSSQIVQSKIVPGEILVSEDQAIQSTKLNELVKIIRKVPKDELILIFVQISHLLPVASNALKAAKIEHRMVTQTNLKGIGEFTDPPKPKKGTTQPSSRPKALILNLGNSMAAGLNLQCANHVIFLSPYHTASDHEYDAGMTQAIGRARRFGQNRKVYAYHLLVKNTYEVNIFQKGQSRKLVERQGVPALIPQEEVLPDDIAYEGEELPE